MSWVLGSGRKSMAERAEQRRRSLGSGMMRVDCSQKNSCASRCVLLMSTNLEEHCKLCTLHRLGILGIIGSNKDRIIAKCPEKGCPFYMTGSEIKGRRHSA
jgi:hypothetical protein